MRLFHGYHYVNVTFPHGASISGAKPSCRTDFFGSLSHFMFSPLVFVVQLLSLSLFLRLLIFVAL